MKTIYFALLLFFLISLPFSSADFLCILYGNNTSVITEISTKDGSVSTLGTSSSIMDRFTFTSQYYASANMLYILYSAKYLFSFDLTTRANQTILLPVPSTGALVTFCVSQQFGTLYSLLVESGTVNFMNNIDSGSLQTVAYPFTLKSTSNISQCIVDDAYSRILWTIQTTTGYSIASTDLLPQNNGYTRIIYDTSSILQAWLLFDSLSESFYAMTVKQGSLHLSTLYLSFETVKWQDIGSLPVNATDPQGVLSPAGDYVAVMTQGGVLELFSVVNISVSSTIKVAWGDMNSLAVNSLSLTWIDGSVKSL